MLTMDTPKSLENFIVLEGIDGSGTTTQLGCIETALQRANLSCCTTAEPTKDPIGLFIRSVLSGDVAAEQSTIAYLFAADRNEHVHGPTGILAKAKENVVVCDRYILSSLAYQGLGCGPELPFALNSRFPVPGLTLFFAIDPSLAMKRVERRNALEIYEKLHIQKLVAERYAALIDDAKSKGWNIIEIDASLSVGEVTNSTLKAISDYLRIDLS